MERIRRQHAHSSVTSKYKGRQDCGYGWDYGSCCPIHRLASLTCLDSLYSVRVWRESGVAFPFYVFCFISVSIFRALILSKYCYRSGFNNDVQNFIYI